MIAPFQSKTGWCYPEKIQKLKNYILKRDKLDNVIIKKAHKAKRYQNDANIPTIEVRLVLT